MITTSSTGRLTVSSVCQSTSSAGRWVINGVTPSISLLRYWRVRAGACVGGSLLLAEVGQDGIELTLVLDELEDGRPVSVAHVAGHQVARVVARDLGIDHDLRDGLRDRIGIVVQRNLLVDRDLAAAPLDPNVLGVRGRKVFQQRPRLRGVL